MAIQKILVGVDIDGNEIVRGDQLVTGNESISGNQTVFGTLSVGGIIYGNGSGLTNVFSTPLSTDSIRWNNTYNTVTAKSANWDLAFAYGSVYAANSANGGSNTAITTIVSANSANWNASYTYVINNSANIADTRTVVTANSTIWGGSNTSFTILTANTGNWNTSYTYVTANSASILDIKTTVNGNSAKWNNSYTVLTANSSLWNGSNTIISSNSGNWNSAYTIANIYAANSANPSFTTLTVTNSATLNKVSIGTTAVDPSSNLFVLGNVNINGNISATGSMTFTNTLFNTTSALSVINSGTGPALIVKQAGEQSIAGFYDDNNIALWVDGTSVRPGYVGIKTNAPNKELTVIGSISATQNLFVNSITANSILAPHTQTASTITDFNSAAFTALEETIIIYNMLFS